MTCCVHSLFRFIVYKLYILLILTTYIIFLYLSPGLYLSKFPLIALENCNDLLLELYQIAGVLSPISDLSFPSVILKTPAMPADSPIGKNSNSNDQVSWSLSTFCKIFPLTRRITGSATSGAWNIYNFQRYFQKR